MSDRAATGELGRGLTFHSCIGSCRRAEARGSLIYSKKRCLEACGDNHSFGPKIRHWRKALWQALSKATDRPGTCLRSLVNARRSRPRYGPRKSREQYLLAGVTAVVGILLLWRKF